jgi:hypothetical protein
MNSTVQELIEVGLPVDGVDVVEVCAKPCPNTKVWCVAADGVLLVKALTSNEFLHFGPVDPSLVLV